jgi:damage-control phosphatase, subfamily III
MEYETKIPQTYQTSDPNSFGYTTVVDRWPAILTGAIDDVHRTISSLPDSQSSKIQEGKFLVSSLATLKYEIQHNRKLTPLPDDGGPDIAGYNTELEARGPPRWHAVEWLYAECYVYRRIATLFALSSEWKDYDVFNRQKMSTFKSSRPAVLELSGRYRDIITHIREGHAVVNSSDPEKVEEAERMLFTEMAEICLWGNATDLSLLTNLTYDDIQKLQGSKARKESEKNVLVNDMEKAFAILNAAKKSNKEQRRVDIVLDNAGFELFVDLLLAGYLLATGLATEVVMHPKNIPWFVSDVMPKDLANLLGAMADPKSFYEKAEEGGKVPEPLSENEARTIKFLFDDWSHLHADGRLILRPNAFWTHAGSFWRMPHTAPELLEDMKESELVIFKGDLNYRKLTGDVSPFLQLIFSGTACFTWPC